MSKLAENEPEHWHDADTGMHCMKDPRKIPGWFPGMWDAEEKAYASHLVAHEAEVKRPQRRDNDAEVIRTFFDLIENNEAQNKKLHALIAAYRMERASQCQHVLYECKACGAQCNIAE